LFEKYGIDVIIDSKELNLDDVEPFNTAMTSKWVDKQISSGEWTDISPKDVIVDEMTTPYEALLRYRKIRAEKGKGTPLFDHPDNESTFDTSPVNQKNFISMVDDELNRLRPESPRRGLASSTAANPRGTISKESDGTLKWVPVPEAPDVVDEDFEKYLENLKIKPQEPRILVKVDTVEEAVMALLDGHDVDVPDVEGAHTLIDDFARMVVTLEKMAAEGQIDKETLSNVVFDLCQITIKGVSIFCLGNKGIPRNLMPQAEGKVVADSPAEKLLEKQNAERLAKGEKVKDEVNASVEFVNFLKEQGLKISDAQYVQSNKLKATQRDMQGQNVAKMLSSAKAGTWNPGASPIFISRDGYVIDGHHRWAAQLGLDFADGILGNNHEMNVRVVDAPISQIMRLANEFTETFGIAKKSVAKKSDQSPSYSKDVLQVVRNNALMGGSGQIDFGNLTSREQQNVVDFAASLPKTRGLSSSTSIDDIFGTPPGRTVGQKLEDGPLELPFGRDELGVPRVETPENLKKKFGYSKGQVRRYFKKNYGIDIEVKKSLFKEMDSFEDGSKRPSLRNNAAYSSLQALDDLLVNTPGMKGLLKDNNFSIEISDGGIEGRMGMFIPDSALGKFTVRGKFFRTTRFREGGKQKTKITVSIHEIDSLADKFFRMEYPFNSGQVRVQNPGQRTESFSVQGGSTVSALGVLNLPPRYRDLDDNQKVEARTEFAGRLAYATMVHEFGHLLDFSMRDKTKLDKLKLPSTMKKFLKSLLSGGEKIDLGGSPEDIYQSALKAQEIERGLAATRYGAEKAAEALAEAFASWFLFARAPKIRVQSGKRIKKTDINGEEVIETLGDLWHQPAKISQDTIFPLLEKLGQNIKSAQIDDPVNLEDLDPLVVAFALMPLLIKNPKSGKIGRRRTRRTNRSEDRRKEFAQT